MARKCSVEALEDSGTIHWAPSLWLLRGMGGEPGASLVQLLEPLCHVDLCLVDLLHG